jgi:hypothetical protein
MINLPEDEGDLRNQLEIPQNSLVFGRTGGLDTWNIPFASEIVKQIVEQTSNIYFLFQNTPNFYNHSRIKFVASTPDLYFKVKFINTCSAMLHARLEGESFGLACGEFSVRNKRVVTYKNSPERNHIHVLKEKALYYCNQEELKNTLLNFKYEPHLDWNAYKEFTPYKVMQIFKKVFLD